MALPDDLRLVKGAVFVFGESGGTIRGLSVTHALAVDALANGSGRMSAVADLAVSGRVPRLLRMEQSVETGTAPTAGTTVEAYAVFSDQNNLFAGKVTGSEGAYPSTVADNKKQLGMPTNILKATADANTVLHQEGEYFLCGGQYMCVVQINLLGQAFRDEATAANNGSGIVVTAWYETLVE